MKLPNKYYEVLKWVVLIALPAIGLFIQAVGPTTGMNTELVNIWLNAITVLLGSLIGVSTYTYRKDDHDEK